MRGDTDSPSRSPGSHVRAEWGQQFAQAGPEHWAHQNWEVNQPLRQGLWPGVSQSAQISLLPGLWRQHSLVPAIGLALHGTVTLGNVG